MTLIDAKNIADTYYRINNLRTFLDCGRSLTQTYTLTETYRDGSSRTITIKYDQVKILLKELEKELDMLEAALSNSQIVIRPNELTMGIKNNG